MGSSSPAGAYSNQGGPASVYNPQYQGPSDSAYWQTLQPLIQAASGGGSGTPAAWAYPQAQELVAGNLLGQGTPWAQQAMDTARTAGLMGMQGATGLQQGANSILNTAFDPQSALFNQTQQQVSDQSNAANAMAGLGGTPYGASVAANAASNFDINWQNQQLGRQRQGLQSAGSIYPEASNLYATSGGLPYSTGANITGNALQGLGSAVQLGNQQYALPQQVLQDLSGYMNQGQNASQLSGQLGQMGLQEQGNAMSGFGGLLGTGLGMFAGGPNSAVSGIGSALGGMGS